jgi:ADP-ribosylglycohydrolase
LLAISRGVNWREAAFRANAGSGSRGNGGAMRVAPVGAYFARPGSHDYPGVVDAARSSAIVTHVHPEGIAGAIAVAVATTWAVGGGGTEPVGQPLLDVVLDWTPDSKVRNQIATAQALSGECSSQEAAGVLGSGSQAFESVPFSLWCAARHGNDFTEALWQTLAGDGDRDTNCAIVGGIVGARLGQAGMPASWLEAREDLTLIDL